MVCEPLQLVLLSASDGVGVDDGERVPVREDHVPSARRKRKLPEVGDGGVPAPDDAHVRDGRQLSRDAVVVAGENDVVTPPKIFECRVAEEQRRSVEDPPGRVRDAGRHAHDVRIPNEQREQPAVGEDRVHVGGRDMENPAAGHDHGPRLLETGERSAGVLDRGRPKPVPERDDLRISGLEPAIEQLAREGLAERDGLR